jgi:hypothetical protein
MMAKSGHAGQVSLNTNTKVIMTAGAVESPRSIRRWQGM